MSRDDILAAVLPLVGRRLAIARLGGAMRGLHFGQVTEDATGSRGEFALHLQCPWRIDGAAGTLAGSADLWEHATLKVPPEDWDFEQGDSLQDARLGALLGGYDARTRSWVNNADDRLVVTGVDATAYGDLVVELTGGYTLRVFPAGSREESWRLLPLRTGGPHFVHPPEPPDPTGGAA